MSYTRRLRDICHCYSQMKQRTTWAILYKISFSFSARGQLLTENYKTIPVSVVTDNYISTYCTKGTSRFGIINLEKEV